MRTTRSTSWLPTGWSTDHLWVKALPGRLRGVRPGSAPVGWSRRRADHGDATACCPHRRRPPRLHCPKCRSEEHTSEPQSLMRTSYAVFSLKKKKVNTTYTVNHKHKYTNTQS